MLNVKICTPILAHNISTKYVLNIQIFRISTLIYYLIKVYQQQYFKLNF